jgi:hypothetical protein
LGIFQNWLKEEATWIMKGGKKYTGPQTQKEKPKPKQNSP